MMEKGDLYEAVLSALENFSNLEVLAASPLQELELTRAFRARAVPSPSPLMVLPSAGLAAQCLLDAALGSLQEEQPAMAELLREHFRRGRPAPELFQERHQSRTAFYEDRKKAVQALADQIAVMEVDTAHHAAGRRRALRMLLPQATYAALVGVDGQVAALAHALERNFAAPGSILAVTGMGGLGKTSLARAALEQWLLATHAEVEHVLWGVLSQAALLDGFAMGERVRHSMDEVLAQWGTQLDEPLHALPQPEQRLRRLAERLAREPSVVVLDNIETETEQDMALTLARALAPYAPVLLTSRLELRAPTVQPFPVRELGCEDAAALMELEATRLKRPAPAPSTTEEVFSLVGGNPLVLKLVAAQLTLLPPAQVLAGIRRHTGSMKRIYEHVFETAWGLLSPATQHILLGLLFLPLSGSLWEGLRVAVESGGAAGDDATLAQAVQELASTNLLQVSSHLEPVYSLHRLTYRYLELKHGLVEPTAEGAG